MRDTRTVVIDSLRGLAAIFVALFHFNEPYPALGDPVHQVFKYGWLGVPVFFVISGYCIAHASQNTTHRSFFVRRLLRIYPPYWASLGLILGIIVWHRLSGGVSDIPSPPRAIGDILKTFACWVQPASIPDFLSLPDSWEKAAAGARAMNWVYWSLIYEVLFYVVMGVFFVRQKYAWALIAFTVACIFTGQSQFPFDRWGNFALGVACYLWVAKRHTEFAVLAAAALTQTIVCVDKPHLVAPIAAVTALLVMFPPPMKWLLNNRTLASTGKVSYSLYLIHVPIGIYLLTPLTDRFFSRAFVPALARDFLLLAICLAASWLFFKCIEEPSHRLARKLGKS